MEAWEDELRQLLADGRKIDAIRLYQQQKGVSLPEAKDWVERALGEKPSELDPAAAGELDQQVLDLCRSGKLIEAIKLYRSQTGLGLKEAKDAVEALAAQHGVSMPKGSGCAGVLLVLIAAAFVVWARWPS
ncbi:MAG TPA: ribosomal protein L7/L12 [Pirellulales bacterium]|nr:ribosomal protein L7/L12 [Pirellulales bacterium]